jgi:uncharacterized protein YjbI with pentapeptide repeats
VTSLPPSKLAPDIRGQHFDQAVLPQDLQGAIAGQKSLPKGLLLLAMALGCGIASVLVAVLSAHIGLELISLGRLGDSFFECLAITVVVVPGLLLTTYYRWDVALGAGLLTLVVAIVLQVILGRAGVLALGDGLFFIITAITVLAISTIYALAFGLSRWALAVTDILFLRAMRFKLGILAMVALGAVAGSAFGSSSDPNDLGGIPAATTTETLFARIFGISFTLAVTLLAWATNRRYRTPWQYPDRVRDWALAWGTVGGTSFHNLDLNQVNFAGASLANTDLRGKSLYRTCFRQAQRLERARTDSRYLDLDNPKVQHLLTQGTSVDKDLRGLNLQGINLRHIDDCPAADLQEIDFAGANLMGADLRGADLTGSNLAQANLVNADLSGATLTDVCIEDWHINPSTRFQGVTCQRVFLRRSSKGHFLDPQPERGEFQSGEFEAWIAAIQRSVSLSFQEAVNPQALAFALTQTALNYHAPDLFSVQKIDPQGQGATAQIDIASENLLQLDKAEVQQALNTQYQAAVQRLEAGYELTLQAKDSEIQHVRQLFATQQQMIERLTGQLAERSSPVMIQGEGNQIYMIQNAGGMTVTNQETNINAGGNVDMSSGTRISVGGDLSGTVDMSTGGRVSVGGDVVGSSILSTLSGQVTTSIQQLRGVEVSGSDELADILSTIQQAINEDSALSEDQKKEALEAVETIAEEGKKPPEKRTAKLCSMAMNALKGVVATVSDVSTLATVLQSSLPPLLLLLGL